MLAFNKFMQIMEWHFFPIFFNYINIEMTVHNERLLPIPSDDGQQQGSDLYLDRTNTTLS